MQRSSVLLPDPLRPIIEITAHVDIQIHALEHVVIAVELLHLINGDERH